MTHKRKSPIALKLPDDLDQHIRAMAATNHRSLTAEITVRLLQTLKQKESSEAQCQTA